MADGSRSRNTRPDLPDWDTQGCPLAGRVGRQLWCLPGVVTHRRPTVGSGRGREAGSADADGDMGIHVVHPEGDGWFPVILFSITALGSVVAPSER